MLIIAQQITTVDTMQNVRREGTQAFTSH